MECPSCKMIVKEFDLFSLAKKRLGGEMVIPRNSISWLRIEENKGSLNSERQVLPEKKKNIIL